MDEPYYKVHRRTLPLFVSRASFSHYVNVLFIRLEKLSVS